MIRKEIRRSIIGTPMEEIAFEEFEKAQYKGVGHKRKLNI